MSPIRDLQVAGRPQPLNRLPREPAAWTGETDDRRPNPSEPEPTFWGALRVLLEGSARR